MQVNIINDYVKVINDDLSENLTGYWTGLTAALSESLTPVGESAAQAAVRYEAVGRQMTDLAADYANRLMQAAEGLGHTFIHKSAKPIAQRP